jgi:hypothetical protein
MTKWICIFCGAVRDRHNENEQCFMNPTRNWWGNHHWLKEER